MHPGEVSLLKICEGLLGRCLAAGACLVLLFFADGLIACGPLLREHPISGVYAHMSPGPV